MPPVDDAALGAESSLAAGCSAGASFAAMSGAEASRAAVGDADDDADGPGRAARQLEATERWAAAVNVRLAYGPRGGTPASSASSRRQSDGAACSVLLATAALVTSDELCSGPEDRSPADEDVDSGSSLARERARRDASAAAATQGPASPAATFDGGHPLLREGSSGGSWPWARGSSALVIDSPGPSTPQFRRRFDSDDDSRAGLGRSAAVSSAGAASPSFGSTGSVGPSSWLGAGLEQHSTGSCGGSDWAAAVRQRRVSGSGAVSPLAPSIGSSRAAGSVRASGEPSSVQVALFRAAKRGDAGAIAALLNSLERRARDYATRSAAARGVPSDDAAVASAAHDLMRSMLDTPWASPGSSHGWCLLHVAAEQAQLQIATLLLERGACARPVHAQSGWTPLHFAARDGRPELTAALLEARADGGASEAKGYTPLHLALAQGHDTVAAMLIQASPHAVHTRTAQKSQSALHVAARLGRLQSTSLLLRARADPAALDSSGLTSLDLALANGHAAVCELLRRCLPKHAECAAGTAVELAPLPKLPPSELPPSEPPRVPLTVDVACGPPSPSPSQPLPMLAVRARSHGVVGACELGARLVVSAALSAALSAAAFSVTTLAQAIGVSTAITSVLIGAVALGESIECAGSVDQCSPT